MFSKYFSLYIKIMISDTLKILILFSILKIKKNMSIKLIEMKWN